MPSKPVIPKGLRLKTPAPVTDEMMERLKNLPVTKDPAKRLRMQKDEASTPEWRTKVKKIRANRKKARKNRQAGRRK